MSRPRVSVAVIRDSCILMCRYEYPDRAFWTLPGGGVRPGESLEQAALRETWEEACMAVQIVRMLFEEPYPFGMETCFLAEPLGEVHAIPGEGPDVEPDDSHITAIAWHLLDSMKDNHQVSLVIAALADN